MILPKRIAQHVTETSSYKIFSNSIPDHWIIRDVTERDYGIDCYIELVSAANEVTGELISIQLKGTEGIDWNKDNLFTFSGINISTTNYWYKFPVPVFICLVDITTKEVFYLPVRSSVRKNFIEYNKQGAFSYKFKKEDAITIANLPSFLRAYFMEKQSDELERNITTFVSHHEQYQNFISENVGRDVFLEVEPNRILYLKHFYNNLRYLCSYFNVAWNIPTISEYHKVSLERFGDDSELYEQQMDEAATELEKKLIPVLLKIREHITETEKSYWIVKDLAMFNVMINVKDDGTIPYF